MKNRQKKTYLFDIFFIYFKMSCLVFRLFENQFSKSGKLIPFSSYHWFLFVPPVIFEPTNTEFQDNSLALSPSTRLKKSKDFYYRIFKAHSHHSLTLTDWLILMFGTLRVTKKAEISCADGHQSQYTDKIHGTIGKRP